MYCICKILYCLQPGDQQAPLTSNFIQVNKTSDEKYKKLARFPVCLNTKMGCDHANRLSCHWCSNVTFSYVLPI
jgi:hypothetical protein